MKSSSSSTTACCCEEDRNCVEEVDDNPVDVAAVDCDRGLLPSLLLLSAAAVWVAL